MSIWVFVKIIVYLWWPIVTHTFVTNYLWYDIQNVDNILAWILTVFVIAESISIAQNLIVAQTKDESYSETDTITHLLSLAKKSLAYLFYSLISNLENSLEDKKTTKKI